MAFVSRGYSSAASTVVAPKPCQTTSRRAEFTDAKSAVGGTLRATIMWADRSPRSSVSTKISSWASDSEDDEQKEQKDAVRSLQSTEPRDHTCHNSSPSSSTEHQQSAASEKIMTVDVNAKRELGCRERRHRDTSKGKKEGNQLSTVLQVMKRPCNGEVKQLSRPNDVAYAAQSNDTDKQKPKEEAPALASWTEETQILEDAEKERQRQIRATEQQQLVLQQVAAARHRRRVALVPKTSIACHDIAQIKEDKGRHHTRRERKPRTKGVLFTRLANGTLSRVDRHGEKVPLQENFCDMEPDVVSEENLKEKESSECGENKSFVAASSPRVSAWMQGPPLSTNGAPSRRSENHCGANRKTQEHTFDRANSANAGIDDHRDPENNCRQHHKSIHRDRRPGRGEWSKQRSF